jgi:hypothetical protein
MTRFLLALAVVVSSGLAVSGTSGLSGANLQALPDHVAQHQPITATVTRVEMVRGPLEFSNPLLGIKGTIEPRAGHVLQIVEIALGDTDVSAELSTFVLVTAGDAQYAPVAVGGGSHLLFPVARLPTGREIAQILPTDAIVAVTKNSETSLTLEATAMATLAFLYDVPQDAAVKTLKLPDGSALALDKQPIGNSRHRSRDHQSPSHRACA